MKQQMKFRRTSILAVSFVGFLAGLGLARVVDGLLIGWALAVAGTIIFVISFRRRALLALLAVVLTGTGLGILRGGSYLKKLQPYQRLYGQEVKLKAVADSDAVYAAAGQLEFDATDIEVTTPAPYKLPGKVQVRGLGVSAVYRGDIVIVSGKLFPSRGSRQGRVSFAQMSVVGRSGSWIESIRHKFVAGIQSALPEPGASFALGLLIGQRNTLPADITAQLSVVGLTHIIAVSGYNLTIIIRGGRRLLGKLSKYQSTVASLILIGGFLLFTGFSASIVRAAIVSVLSLWAWYYGRRFKPLLLISLTAAVTAGWNPLYIWSDIGWYMSFLAFFGVLILAPLIKTRLFGDKKQKFLGQVVLESISAQIMVAPLILYIFSETSLVALLSNAVVVPLVPFAMVFSLVAGLAGMVLPVIAGIFAWPAAVLTTYMLDVVGLFARVPHAHVQRTISLAIMIFLYVLVLAATLLLYHKLKAKYGTITDTSVIE